jgi:hypothetical protein
MPETELPEFIPDEWALIPEQEAALDRLIAEIESIPNAWGGSCHEDSLDCPQRVSPLPDP